MPTLADEPDEDVGWVLRNSVDDIGYRMALPRLSLAGLIYCLEREARKTGLRRLQAEARRRLLVAGDLDKREREFLRGALIASGRAAPAPGRPEGRP